MNKIQLRESLRNIEVMPADARRVMIDGVYEAYLLDREIDAQMYAFTSGNVIVIDPRVENVNELLEHEYQHVIQYYDFPNLEFDRRSAKHHLPFEIEACARSIIMRDLWTNYADFIGPIVGGLVSGYGMDAALATRFA